MNCGNEATSIFQFHFYRLLELCWRWNCSCVLHGIRLTLVMGQGERGTESEIANSHLPIMAFVRFSHWKFLWCSELVFVVHTHTHTHTIHLAIHIIIIVMMHCMQSVACIRIGCQKYGRTSRIRLERRMLQIVKRQPNTQFSLSTLSCIETILYWMAIKATPPTNFWKSYVCEMHSAFSAERSRLYFV